MTELILLPPELNEFALIDFMKDLEKTIETEYKNLLDLGKTKKEALRILIYATINSIEINVRGSKTYYVNKTELEHGLAGADAKSVSQKDLEEKFDNFENNKKTLFLDEVDRTEAEKRIEKLKTFCEKNKLIPPTYTNNILDETPTNTEDMSINIIESKALKAIEILNKIADTPIEDIQTIKMYLSKFEDFCSDHGYKDIDDYKREIREKINILIDENDPKLKLLINIIKTNNINIFDEDSRTGTNGFLDKYKESIKETNEIINDFTNIFLDEKEITTITTTKTIENLAEYLKTGLQPIIDSEEYLNYGTTEESFIPTLFEIFEKIKEKMDGDTDINFLDALDNVLDLILDNILDEDISDEEKLEYKSKWIDLIFYSIYNQYLDGSTENRENAIAMLTNSIDQLRYYGTYSNSIETQNKTIDEITTRINGLSTEEQAFVNYILSGYYGQNGELLESSLDIKLEGETTLEKFKNSLIKIGNDEEQKYQGEWIHFLSTNPDFAVTAISQTELIYGEYGISILSRREFDIFSIIALSKAYGESEVLQNLKEEEYLSLIAYSIRFPPYYSILLFENHKLIDSVFSQISNHSEQINILSIIDQLTKDIYMFSSNNKRIENISDYLSADLKRIGGTRRTNIESIYLINGNEIDIRNQKEVINTEYIGDIYSQFNPFSMFSPQLDIAQGVPYNNRQGKMYQKGNIRTHVTNPSFLESRLQFKNSPDRIISGLYVKYYEIMSTKEKMSFDRVMGDGRVEEGYGSWNTYDAELNTYLSGPKGETLYSSVNKNKKTTDWNYKNEPNETIEETNLSLSGSNVRFGAVDFTKFIFDLNENVLKKDKDGILELSEYNIRSNLDLIANIGKGNFSIRGILDNSIDAENNTDSRIRYLEMDIRYGTEGTEWVKIKVDIEKLEKLMETEEYKEYKEKYHIYQETMNEFGNVGIHLGTETVGIKKGISGLDGESTRSPLPTRIGNTETSDLNEKNNEFALGFFISGEIPINEDLKTAGLIIRTKEGEYNISSTLERKDIHVYTVGISKISDEEFDSYSKLALDSSEELTFKKNIDINITELSFEYLLKDKIRVLTYFQAREDQGLSGGGTGVNTTFLNTGVLYEYDEKTNTVNWRVSGSLKLNIKNTKYILKTFALEEEDINEYGCIFSASNKKLECRIFGKISEEITNNTNLLRTNKGEAFLHYLETLESKYSNYIQNLKQLDATNSDQYTPTKIRYEQELVNDFKSLVSALHSFDIDVYGNAPQQFGIQLIDKINQSNVMITLKSTDFEDPKTGEKTKRLFLSGITGVNTKAGDFSLMLGTFLDNKNIKDLNTEDISNLVGLKYQRPKLALSVYATNIDKNTLERNYGGGVSIELKENLNLNIDYLRTKQKLWHIETAIGNDRNAFLFDYGQLKNLEYLGIGGKITITERLALEGLINWTLNMDNNTFRTVTTGMTGWFKTGKNAKVGLNITQLDITGENMKETVFEVGVQIEASF